MCLFTNFLSLHKDAISAAQSIVTILAIFIGGVWTYRLFVKKRLSFPKLALTQSVETILKGTNSKTVIRTKIFLKNIGETKVELDRVKTRVQQIEPNQYVDENGEVVSLELVRKQDESEMNWPLLDEVPFNIQDTELEPGENEEIICDHVIPSNIQKVSIYTYISNKKKRSGFLWLTNREIGWHTTTTHNIQ